MRVATFIAAFGVGAALSGTSAAQHYGSYDNGYGHGSSRQSHSSGWDIRSQLDRPGDYRCDAYWDANRNDCGERWRDQRRYSGSGYGYSHGYGHGYERGHTPQYANTYGHGYSSHQQGYSKYGSHGGYGNSGYGNAGANYYGAYGRPDVVYSGGGHSGGYSRARDPHRIDWCRASYRSYDANSGYYRAYSGQLIFCG